MSRGGEWKFISRVRVHKIFFGSRVGTEENISIRRADFMIETVFKTLRSMMFVKFQKSDNERGTKIYCAKKR